MRNFFLSFSCFPNPYCLTFRFRVILFLFIVSLLFAEQAKSESLDSPAFQQDKFEHTALHWSEQVKNYAETGETSKQITALLQLADIYQRQGLIPASISALNNANTLSDHTKNPRQKISVLSSLGAAYTAMGKYNKATELLQKSEKKARSLQATHLLAAILNNQGNLQIQKGEFNRALKFYEESILLAQTAGNLTIAVKASINLAISASKTANITRIEESLISAKKHLEKAKNSHKKAFNWITLGQIAQKLSNNHPNHSQWQAYAHHAFKQANTLGERMSDARAISYAKGNMGKLYADEGRHDEALRLTQQAIFALESINAAEILFRWQWQLGRLLKQKGDNPAAISAYQQAISTLQPLRQKLFSQHSAYSSFKEEISPLYLELTDLLLLSSNKLADQNKIQHNLMLARTTMEQLKAAELQDYFKDDCVASLQKKIRPLDSIGNQTAAIYPILLDDRFEILLSLPEGLKRFTLPVGREQITKQVRQFRHNLENRTTREYLNQARQLYQWLIAPIQSALEQQKIDTLVIVPDESLRTIPMAALHDGNAFLIEQYAIATTPGLNLTDPEPLHQKNVQILSTGLTQSIQGFSPLPHVASELKSIQKIFGGELLQDQAFLLKNVEKKLQQNTFNIIHIASHGQFKSDANENFVLTFDDKLNMNKLEKLIGLSKFRNNPIELLTLSACQTAAGDDRAALGLAGIAIKAGARSAVATLWFINDQAASDLVAEFYRQLKQSSTSKAQALKNAQTHLIRNTSYQHPYYWSPFMLIGNWL